MNLIRTLLYVITFSLLIIYTKIAHAEWPDVDIDLVTCQPDGVVASLKEKWDPLDFWAWQVVDLEEALEQENLDFIIQHCKIEHQNDKKEYIECVSAYKNRHAAIIKCLRHAKRMLKEARKKPK